MIKKDVPLSNDQVDKHGDKMTINALRSARDQTNSNIIISHDEHDFRLPPIGRMEKAYIRNIQGVNWLLGEFRLFALEDVNHENRLKGRQIVIHDQALGAVSVACDRSYEVNDLVPDVELLQKAFDSSQEISYEYKKSVDPISTLTIIIGLGATFATSNFLAGFFNEAGKDAWGILKNILHKNNKINPNTEKQYQFIFTLNNSFYKSEFMLIFTNPDPEDIEDIIRSNQEEFDKKIIYYYENSIKARRIVYTCQNGEILHAYSVYECGTPFDISNISEYKRILNSKF